MIDSNVYVHLRWLSHLEIIKLSCDEMSVLYGDADPSVVGVQFTVCILLMAEYIKTTEFALGV